MKRYTWRMVLAFCILVILISLNSSETFALDPMFELDTKALGNKDQVNPKERENSSEANSVGSVIHKKPADNATAKRIEGKKASSRKTVRKSSDRAKGKRGATSVKRRRVPQKSAALRGTEKDPGVRRAHVSKSDSFGTVGHTFRMSAENGGGVQWARDIWNRILLDTRHENGPLVVQGRNFSLSLDSARYPVLPAADGGKIILDREKTLAPLVKTILREKDPGIRIVAGYPDNRKHYFASLLAAANFYSVEENFTADFGTDPKLTVTSDFKIEKTSESLLNNDIILVNVSGSRAAMPASLLSFLNKEGFHVIGSSSAFSEATDGRKAMYCIEGSSQNIIVDELLSALSTPCEKNKDLLLDDGALSGVTLSVTADRYSESNNRKIVISFVEENPVQYTLLRLLELKGYRVVMLDPKDDFKEISEKILVSLGLPAVYGMQPLWEQDESPFNVRLSGFVLPGHGRDGVRRFLTNVPIDPLVGELARYKGFDVIGQ